MSDDSITVSQAVTGQIQTWGSLQVLQEIGHGGFGVVYRAWEPSLTREVALKIIRPRDPNPDALAGILREGQLLARVRHPNIVTVYGAQQIGNEVGLWMEFVRGRSLSDLVKHDGPRAANEAAVIGISLCQAVAAVHQAGVLHRDIKAHNVMRESGGRIVLMDFGAGQLLEGPRYADDRAIGTPAYMAPEVLAGGRASARSDIYSLGVLLYYLVTGTYPVEGNSWTDFLLAHARFERRPLGDVRPDIPASFVRIVEKATSLKPDERYSSPGAMLADLSTIATGAVVRPKRSGKTDSRRRKQPEPKRSANRWQIAALVAAPVVVPLLLGIITSATFNLTTGRTGPYAHESIFKLWKWGITALVPGAVQVTVVVLAWMLGAALWRLLIRLARRAAALAESTRERTRTVAERTGLNDPDMAAQALLALQIISLGVFWWYFRDIFSAAISFIDSATANDIEPLRQPEHLVHHQLYNATMALMILLMGVGSYRIIKLRRRAPGAPRTSLMFVFGVIAVSFVVLVFPYRLIWHNFAEVATLGGSRCYVLGMQEQLSRVLLYCPTDPAARVKEVARSDVQLAGIRESIYTRPDTR
jgi:serine/threonine-protein kinase